MLIFHYSGHGAQVAARVPGQEIDGKDECLAPIEYDWDAALIDDDLAQFVEGVPEGANLTVILDNCNSGTGLRLLAPGGVPPTIKRIIPPPDIQFRTVDDIQVTRGLNYYSVTMSEFRKLALRRFGQSTTDNGILVAGCRSDQLAKDAFIEGDFHGALTYSLFQAIEEKGPELSYSDWVESATQILKERHQIPEQDPQLECPDELAGWKLFSTEATQRRPVRAVRRTAPRHVVYVHGICRHVRGFSDPWWESMEPFVPSIAAGDRHEVLWSDLVTASDRALQPQQREVAQSIKDVLVDRCERVLIENGPEVLGTERSYEEFSTRSFLGIPGLDCVDDFTKYLMSRPIRNKVIARFDDVVRPLLAAGACPGRPPSAGGPPVDQLRRQA